MRRRALLRGVVVGLGTLGTLASLPLASATETSAQETFPLIWTLTIISVAGAALTFGILLYAIWRFRDPSTKGRRYG